MSFYLGIIGCGLICPDGGSGNISSYGLWCESRLKPFKGLPDEITISYRSYVTEWVDGSIGCGDMQYSVKDATKCNLFIMGGYHDDWQLFKEFQHDESTSSGIMNPSCEVKTNFQEKNYKFVLNYDDQANQVKLNNYEEFFLDILAAHNDNNNSNVSIVVNPDFNPNIKCRQEETSYFLPHDNY